MTDDEPEVKYLAELQAMYLAFRPQNIANPREAAQHISNLRAFDAQQEERIATLTARVEELELRLKAGCLRD